MELLLQRIWDDPECVIGSMEIDGSPECFTLEKPLLFEGQENIHCKTCIPEGRYPVISSYSPKFGRMMPHINAVPNRFHIMFHWGNQASNTDGCVLVGETRVNDTMIGMSRNAFEELDGKLKSAWANSEEIWLEIRNVKFVT